jgi:signal transduction histidine kinase
MTTTGTVSWSQEPEGAYESLVVPRLEQASFQTLDAANGGGRVVYRLQGGGFRHCTCRPLNEALRARFDVAAVQSWPLEGELVHGRLFALDKPRMDIDALSVGELVARIAASRLDGLYMLRELGRAAALDERVKVASDLHDSLLQSLAGVALQLLVARRLIGRDPAAAAGQLDEIQKQIEQGELETRSFIRRLRPRTARVSGVSPAGLAERLEGLGRRIERQWSVKVKTQVEGTPDRWPDGLGDEVFRVAREGILNAARHADASLVTVQLGAVDSTLRLEIVDDGGGFPFHGTFDLGALERMDQGPWSVKERVHALRGKLELTSTDSGSRLLITVPCAAKAG